MDKDFKKNWKAAIETRKTDRKATGGDYPEWPNGEYIVDLVGAERGESKAGNPQVKFEFAVVDGPEGVTSSDIVYKYDSLKEQQLVWFQRRLDSMGVEVPEDPEGALDALLVELVGKKPRYKMTMWKKGDYQRYKLAPHKEGEEAETEPEDVSVED